MHTYMQGYKFTSHISVLMFEQLWWDKFRVQSRQNLARNTQTCLNKWIDGICNKEGKESPRQRHRSTKERKEIQSGRCSQTPEGASQASKGKGAKSFCSTVEESLLASWAMAGIRTRPMEFKREMKVLQLYLNNCRFTACSRMRSGPTSWRRMLT